MYGRKEENRFSLTYFMLLVSFSTTWKYQKTRGFVALNEQRRSSKCFSSYKQLDISCNLNLFGDPCWKIIIFISTNPNILTVAIGITILIIRIIIIRMFTVIDIGNFHSSPFVCVLSHIITWNWFLLIVVLIIDLQNWLAAYTKKIFHK